MIDIYTPGHIRRFFPLIKILATIALLIILTAEVVLIVIKATPLGAQWGTVPEYFAGLAFMLATIAYINGVSKDKTRSRRRQAGQVSAWVTSYKRLRSNKKGLIYYELRVSVRNDSNLPIFDYSTLPDDMAWNYGPDKNRILSPKITIKEVHRFYYEEEISPYQHPRVYLMFTDAANITWSRLPDGRLIES